MKVWFDRTGAERKVLVTAISEITGEKAKYMGAPGFAYSVGSSTITKDGTLEVGGGEDISSLLAALEKRGIVPAEAHEAPSDEEESTQDTVSDIPETMVIELPADGFSDVAYENLLKLVAGKAALIRKAIGDCMADGAGALTVTRDEENVYFPWFRFGMESDEVFAWSTFICLLSATAQKQKRVILKEKSLGDGDSEKFAMRCFLLKLGFIGDEYKLSRKVILTGLSGDGSHKKAKKEPVTYIETDELAEALADAELIHSVNASFEEDGCDRGRDCLSCGQSMSEPGEDGSGHDRLFCAERQDYVEEDWICPAYNR